MQLLSRTQPTTLLISVLLVLGVACSKQEPAAKETTKPTTAGKQVTPAVEAADFVFINGKVYTVNELQPWAEAVAVTGNEIVYVGDAAGAEARVGEGTERIDLGGKTMLPGFVSTHDHLIASAWMTYGVQLFDLETKADVLARIREYAEANPDEKVIKGVGWSAGKFGGNPTAKELDQAVSDRPAIILDFTVHDGWLNTRAMEMANVTRDTPDGLPGVTYWLRDQEGNPTGAAWQIRMEDKIGSLEVGKLADLVVLDGNPLEVDPMEIQNIQVDLTMMDGNVIFDRAEETAHQDVVHVEVTYRRLKDRDKWPADSAVQDFL